MPGSQNKNSYLKSKERYVIRTIPISDYAAELCREMNPKSPAAFILTGSLSGEWWQTGAARIRHNHQGNQNFGKLAHRIRL